MTENALNGLEAIILHHSFLRGLRVRIPCHGHANNTGKNGAGKTSALRLIPIFYGFQPDLLMTRAANKLSFVDYYLPSAQSMIIFQYRRAGTLACAVMHRGSQGRAVYRFVSGAADESLICAELQPLFDDGASATEILRAAERRGAMVSKQIQAISTYAAILGNQAERLSDQNLKYLLPHFSLCGRGKSMRYIGELTSILQQSRGKLLERLKVMLTEAFIGKERISDKPIHKENGNLIRTIHSLHALAAEKERLQKGLLQAEMIHASHVELSACRAHLQVLHEKYHHEAQEVSAQLALLQENWRGQENQILDRMKIYEEEGVRLSGRRDGFHKALAGIESQAKEWDKEEIDHKEQLLKTIPQQEEQVTQAQKHYDNLQATHRETLREYERNRSQVESNFHAQMQALWDQEKQQTAQREEERKAEQAALNALHKTQASDLWDFRERQQAALTEQQEEISAKEIACARLAHPNYDEEQEKQHLRAERDRCEAAHAESHAALEKAKEAYQLAVSACKKAQKQLDDQENALAAAQQNAQVLHDALNNDRTLLAFLRASDKPWSENIARVINPQLLKATDLQPHWLDDGNSFYGLALATDKLSLPPEANSLEALETRLQEQLQRISTQENQLEQSRREAKKTHAAMVDAEKIYQQAQGTRARASEQYQNAKLTLRDHEADVQKSCQQRAASLQEAIATIKKQLAEKKQQQKAELAQFEKQQQEAITKKHAEQEKSAQRHRDHLQAIGAQKKALEEEKKTRLTDLEQRKEAALLAQGVDKTLLENAKARLRAAEKTLQRIKSYEAQVIAYRHWKESELSRKEDIENNIMKLSNQLLEQQEKIAQCELDLSRHRANAKEQSAQQEQKADMLSQRSEALKNLAGHIDAILSEASAVKENDTAMNTKSAGADAVVMSASYELFMRQCNTALSRAQAQARELKETVQTVTRIFTSRDDDLARQWQDRMEQHHQLQFGSLAYNLAAIKQLEIMLHSDISQKERTCIENFRAVALSLQEYEESLKRFNRSVRQTSKKLTSELNTDHRFPDLTDIHIELTSNIDRFGISEELSYFTQHWRDYKEGLPDTMLLDAFAKANSALESSNIKSGDLASLVSLSIHLRENNRPYTISRDEDLLDGSSTGLSLLIVVIIFSGLTRYLCSDAQTVIHWPLDEVGRLDPANIARLFALMDKHNIRLFCAQPKLDAHLSHYFNCKNDIDREKGIRQYTNTRHSVADNPLLGESS